MKNMKKFNEMFSNPDGSAISVKDMRHTPSSAKKHLGESQLEKGIKVESEHCDIYEDLEKWMKETYKDYASMPWSKEEFYGKIAKAHLKEDPNYYTKLSKMENTNEDINYDSLDDDQKQWVDSLDDKKFKYFLVIVLNADSYSDVIELESNIEDFHSIHPDVTRNEVPYVMYFSYGWWVEEKGYKPTEFRSIIEKEAKNLGLDVRVMTYGISEKDFELGRDLPPRYANLSERGSLNINN